ncbi:hypothetical protein BH23GEM11_BH23GEM11_13550 [soil metagenome]
MNSVLLFILIVMPGAPALEAKEHVSLGGM